MKIKELSLDDRPREKLLLKGAAALSNAELTAILLRSGTGRQNALDLARTLLARAGNLTELANLPLERMTGIPGIGPEKAATVCAAFELGRRFAAETPHRSRLCITHAGKLIPTLLPHFKGLDHEECWISLLTRGNYLISNEMVSSGGLESTPIDTKVIVRKALDKKAAAVILSHNHPSGNPQPGRADIHETEQVRKALHTFSITLLDHLVICDDRYFSFSEDRVFVGNLTPSP